MTTLTVPQAYQLVRANTTLSHDRACTAVAIALAESSLRTDAVGDVGLQDGTWGPSIGLWQIRSLKAETGKGTARDASRLADPRFNVRAMSNVSGDGLNFGPWSTYKNDAYRTHLPRVYREATQSTGGAPIAPDPSGSGIWSGAAGPALMTPLEGPNAGVTSAALGAGGLAGDTVGLGGAVGDLGDKLLEGLVIAAAVGLGVSLVAVGAWRTVSK